MDDDGDEFGWRIALGRSTEELMVGVDGMRFEGDLTGDSSCREADA